MRINEDSFLLAKRCDNCGGNVSSEDYNGLTDLWLCEECREINAEIDDKIAEGIRAAGYKVY